MGTKSDKSKIAFLSYRALHNGGKNHEKCNCLIGYDSFKGVDVFTTDYVRIKHDAVEIGDWYDLRNIRIKDALLRQLRLSLLEKIVEGNKYHEVYIYLGRGPLIPEAFTWHIFIILNMLGRLKIKARIVGRFEHYKSNLEGGKHFKEELSSTFQFANKNYFPTLDLKWVELPSADIESGMVSLIDDLIDGKKIHFS